MVHIELCPKTGLYNLNLVHCKFDLTFSYSKFQKSCFTYIWASEENTGNLDEVEWWKEVWQFQLFQVRLMGCQDLLDDVPGRSKKDSGVFSSPSDQKSWYKLKPSSSKTYNVKDETSSEIKFCICQFKKIPLQKISFCFYLKSRGFSK